MFHKFPSPPVVPAKISECFDILEDYQINEDTILIGHIKYYDRDVAFSGFEFNWNKIKKMLDTL